MALDRQTYRRLAERDHAPELAFVSACIRAWFGMPDLRAVPSDLSSRTILDIARLNKIANIVAATLDKDAPQKLRQGLETFRARGVEISAPLLRETVLVSTELSRRGLDHLVLKGPLQQQRLFGSYFFKPSGDIDLLVAPGDFKQARTVLMSLGYSVDANARSIWWRSFLGEQHMTRLSGRPLKVDLHHRVQQPGSPSPRGVSWLLAARQIVTVAGAEIAIPCDRDIAILSAMSMVKSLFNHEACGDYACDLRAAVVRLDAEAQRDLIARADEQGLRETLLLALRAVQVVTGPLSGPLAIEAKTCMTQFDDQMLGNMVVAPWLPTIAWPHRRRVLWELCSRKPLRFLAEAGWVSAAELSRRLTDRTDVLAIAPAVAAAPESAAPAAARTITAAGDSPSVAVIIAARNAAQTIGRAIHSALRQPEVIEVIVIDDASSDATSEAALAAAAGSDRLRLVALETNRGPSHARNLALDMASAPFVSILDADDFVLDGRYARLLDSDDWDFVADNIVFVGEGRNAERSAGKAFGSPQRPEYLDLSRFIEGNISRRGVHRGELGYLKPVIRRRFLDANALRYNEKLRLGEDYELYARALRLGARFKVTRSCGYAAVIRKDSLSASHSVDDLDRLADADRALLAQLGPKDRARPALIRHERQARDKLRLRRFLDAKATVGPAAALSYACSHPAILRSVGMGVLADKAGHVAAYVGSRLGYSQASAIPRYLLAVQPMKAE